MAYALNMCVYLEIDSLPSKQIHTTIILRFVVCYLLLPLWCTGYNNQGYSGGVETRANINFKSYDKKPNFCERRFFGHRGFAEDGSRLPFSMLVCLQRIAMLSALEL